MRWRKLARTVTVFELVLTDLAAEGVAMDAEDPRGAGLVAVRAVKHTLDEFLFKFVNRFVKKDPAFHHLTNQAFELLFHWLTLRWQSRSSAAGILVKFASGELAVGFAVLGARGRHHILGKFRPRRLLVPTDPLEIVANKLFVVRRLGAAGLITFGRPKTRGVGGQRFVNPDEFVADQAKFELGVGEQDAARLGIGGGAAGNFYADITNAPRKRAAHQHDRLTKPKRFILPLSRL